MEELLDYRPTGSQIPGRRLD